MQKCKRKFIYSFLENLYDLWVSVWCRQVPEGKEHAKPWPIWDQLFWMEASAHFSPSFFWPPQALMYSIRSLRYVEYWQENQITLAGNLLWKIKFYHYSLDPLFLENWYFLMEDHRYFPIGLFPIFFYWFLLTTRPWKGFFAGGVWIFSEQLSYFGEWS